MVRTIKFYAVKVGRNTGIFNTWKECEEQVKGFSGSIYKSFTTNSEANNWLHDDNDNSDHKKITSYNKSDNKNDNNEISKNDFIKEGILYTPVWTDGCALNNSRSSEYSLAGIGVYFGDDHLNNKSLPLPGVFQTNQRAEIYAVIVALETVGLNVPLIIHTDSKYVINAMTDWIHKWRKNNFRKVLNKDLFQKLDKLVNECTVKPIFKYVPAHSGIYENEEADRLSKLGAMNRN